MMGLPHQRIAEVIETIAYANGLGVLVRLASYSPVPGTRDFQRALEAGLLPQNPDPLLTNKTVMPLCRTQQAYSLYQALRRCTNQLNDNLRHTGRPVKSHRLREQLSAAINPGKGTASALM
jgi:hypothetical protein